MFGWRRRSEGFEWREYVRTTVLVKRADRQRRIDDARMAALNKVKDARDKGVAAGQAGLNTFTSTLRDVTVAFLSAVWNGVRSVAVTTWKIIGAVLREIGDRIPGMPALPEIPKPNISFPKIKLPRIALARVSPDRTMDAPTGATAQDDSERLRPDVPFRLPINPRLIGGVAFAVLLIVVGGPMLRGEADFAAPKAVATVELTAGTAVEANDSASASELSGRARAIKGDLLRIEGRLVKLASIESPAAAYPCKRSNGRSWNCSAAARLALRRMVHGKTVTCTNTGETDSGHLLGRCAIDGQDIGEDLVRNGHVFAAQGFFATYGASEEEAKADKVGIWQGKAVRPEEWRSQVWEEAKQASPEGCPIKGFVRRSDRTYAMPWSSGYGRRMRERRGDRWFCSEEEAREAGFTLAGSLQ